MHHSHRLRKNEEFQKIFQKGVSAANRQFVVYSLPVPGQATFRVGIAVSKKLGNAVVRNRLKRYVREAVACLEDQIKPEVDMVVIARQGVEKMSLDEIVKSLSHVLKRAKLLLAEQASDRGKP